MRNPLTSALSVLLCFGLLSCVSVACVASPEQTAASFPRALDSYDDAGMKGVSAILINRIRQEPFNLAATIIFFCAIIHTFMASKFIAISHKWQEEHQKKIDNNEVPEYSVHHGAKLFHFLGEVEVVFGLWVIPLVWSITLFYDRATWVNYISHDVNFTEALFVVTIMILAASRPILKLAESTMHRIVGVMGGSLVAWWFTILTIGPLLGSLITEPAAMTLCTLLLAAKLYELNPDESFKYATIGLLFVNISVGGTLTHFAAPPVLMVAGPWEWGTIHMLSNFGWKAVVGIVVSNVLYFLVYRSELERLEAEHRLRSAKEHVERTFMRREDMIIEFKKISVFVDAKQHMKDDIEREIEASMVETRNRLEAEYLPRIVEKGTDPALAKAAFNQRFDELWLRKVQEVVPGVLPPEKRAPFVDPAWDRRDDDVPVWITAIHVVFMGWIIWHAHYPQLFIPALLFFLGFMVVSSPYQNRVNLVSPLLVGFFLGGLVVHGGVQGWWIAPVLGNLTEVPLMLISTVLTSFNDNAAITYLSTLVPGFTDELKYAVMTGAVAGGGLTVIANAPNPAGQSILKKYFAHGVSAGKLFKASITPTVIVWLVFLLLR